MLYGSLYAGHSVYAADSESLILNAVDWLLDAAGAPGASVAMDVPPALLKILAGALGGSAVEIATRVRLAIRARAGGARVAYIGPGTGIVVVGDRDPLGLLREGDRQLVILPWAGMGGLVRVPSRTAQDESSRQEFPCVECKRHPDPAGGAAAGEGRIAAACPAGARQRRGPGR